MPDKKPTTPTPPKAYQIVMSRGDNIQLDADELDKVIIAIQKGQPAKVKSGIFNPSFYVSIIEDIKRVEDTHLDNMRGYYKAQGDYRLFGKTNIIEYKKMRPLRDIFKDTKLLSK